MMDGTRLRGRLAFKRAAAFPAEISPRKRRREIAATREDAPAR